MVAVEVKFLPVDVDSGYAPAVVAGCGGDGGTLRCTAAVAQDSTITGDGVARVAAGPLVGMVRDRVG